MTLVFDKQRCQRCGTCMADCVCGILVPDSDGFPFLPQASEARCVQCGHCTAVCPFGAVTLNGRNPATLHCASHPSILSEQTLDALLKGRRAVRQYEGDTVPRDLLEKAFAYAAYAPTAHNFREVSFIVINGRNRVEALLHHLVRHMEKQALYPAHTAAVRQGHDTLFRGAPCIILVHAPQRVLSEADCATAAAYLELALHGLGLGSCWAGMMVEACENELCEGFMLPEGHRLYAVLMTGISKVYYPRLPFRSAPVVRELPEQI